MKKFNQLTVPNGFFASDDAAAAKRKQIAEALKRGEDVVITPSGQVAQSDDPTVDTQNALKAPEGKLASDIF